MPVESKQRSKTMPENPDHCVAENPDIPEILKVPEGHVLLLRANGRGVQKYTCPVNTPPQAAPHAILLASDEDEGDLVAIHFKGPTGPTWQALDGSSVVGKVLQHFPAPVQDGVDWLLLETQSTAGKGMLSGVTHIQRLSTDGGKPPPEGCDQANNQTEVLVEYSAQYFFYGSADTISISE
jgi:Protein of unknown function (DUF3455)